MSLRIEGDGRQRGEIEEKPKKAPKPTKVIDLVKVLQQSLEQTGQGKKKTSKRERHRTHHKKAA